MRENNNIPGVLKYLNSFMKYIADACWSKIIKVYFVMFLFLATFIAAMFLYTSSKNEEIVRFTTKKIMDTQKEENLRDFSITPKIQKELQKMVYSTNADRAFLFELHNGKKNVTGLPFRFADMSYEEINDEKKAQRVAMQFQDIPLTLYKYPHYLQKEKMFVGGVDEIAEIDSEFAKHIRDIGGKYLGMIYMNSSGSPIGFLCISYHDMDDVPQREFIIEKLKDYDRTITPLLDLEVQMKLVN